MPHDASAEIKRLAAWEEMSNRIRDITHNKNVVVLGDLNAALHARKEGEEECLGLQVWGKGLAFLREKWTTTRKYEQEHPYRATKGT